MRRLIYFLLALVMLVGTADAQSRKKKSGNSTAKKSTSSVLPVTKGAVKKYGNYLTTQSYTIKKGKDNEITVEYPIAGNPKLVNAIRSYIKESLDYQSKFTGSMETPEAFLRYVMKGYKDVKYGGDGESIQAEIKVIYNNPTIITLEDKAYSYGGGVHGMYGEVGKTFLVSDGTLLTEEMLPPISSMREYILQGIADDLEIPVSDLSDTVGIYAPYSIEYGNVSITDEGLVFKYQPYEIGPWSAGVIKGTVDIDDVEDMLSEEVLRFFEEEEVPAEEEEVIVEEEELPVEGEEAYAEEIPTPAPVASELDRKIYEAVKSASTANASNSNSSAQSSITTTTSVENNIGKRLSQASNTKAAVNDEPVYDTTEVQASFPGGQAAMMEWLGNNLRYPDEAFKNGIQGRVVVQMIIEEDGTITSPTVVQGVNEILDKEALRVVSSLPKWEPAMIDGKPVRSKSTLPIVFSLSL